MGAKVKKAYYPPATPCDRLLAHAGVEEAVKTALRTQRDPLDPGGTAASDPARAGRAGGVEHRGTQ